MNTDEYLNNYIEKEFIPLITAKLKDTEKFFYINKYDLYMNFKNKIYEILNEVNENISNKQLKVKYITVSQLLTSLWIYNKADFIIKVYDESFEIKSPLYENVINFDEIYKYFFDIYSKSILDIKKYVGKITKFHIKEILMNEIYNFNKFIHNIIFYSLRNESFSDIEYVYFGEYDSGIINANKTVVYSNKLWDKKEKEFITLLSKRDFQKLSLTKYGNLNLSNNKYDFQNIYMSKFNSCYFDNISLRNSTIINSNFRSCTINKVDLSNSILYGTNFNKTNITNTNLSNLNKINNIELGKIYNMSFENSILENVSFDNSNLTGAIFKNADMKNISFDNTILDSAVFSKNILDNIKLTSKQLKDIILI